MRYFKKENIRSEVWGANNKPIFFEPVAGQAGVRALDDTADAALIVELDDFSTKRVGGIVKISAEIYESLKKNEVSNPSPKRSFLNQMRVSPSHDSFNPKVAAPPAEAARIGRDRPITTMEEPPPPSSIGAFRDRVRSRPIGGAPEPG